MRRLIVALGLLLSCSPAALAQGVQHEDKRAEYDAAFQAMLKDPSNLEISFHFAEIATAAGDLEGAIGALERMLIYNPNLPRVRLELGALYFQLGSYDIARTYFTRALDGDPPPEVKQKVKAFLAEIDERASRNHLTASVLAGARYQSNATVGTNGDLRFAVDGVVVTATASGGSAKQHDFNLFAVANATDIYDLQDQDFDTIETNVSIYVARQIALQNLSVTVGEIDIGPRFTLDGTGPNRITIRPYALANLAQLADYNYFHTAGGGIGGIVPFWDQFQLEPTVEVRDRWFQGNEARGDVSAKSGVQTLGRAALGYLATEDDILRAIAQYAANSASSDWESYRETDLGVSWIHTFAAPGDVTPAPWSTSVSLDRLWRNYSGADPAIDPGVTRYDREWIFGASLTIGLSDQLSFVLQAGYDRVGSDIPNYSYINTSATGAIGYKF